MARDGATGFAMKQAFERGFRHIWDAELSQIYPALQRMEKQGLLSSAVTPGERGSSRVYNLTKAGEQQLSDWLRTDPVLHDERHPFLVQLCLLGDLADYQETMRYLLSLRTSLRTRLQTFEQLEEEWRRHDPSYPELAGSQNFHIQMTLEFGLANARAALDTCERCIERLQRRLKSKADGGSKHDRKTSKR
jgi:DNA-binding PadR family transcriptional regulator